MVILFSMHESNERRVKNGLVLFFNAPGVDAVLGKRKGADPNSRRAEGLVPRLEP